MKKLLVLVALLVATVAAHAATVNVLFLGFQPSGWQAGYPYSASINGGAAIAVMCNDWSHGGLPGDTWQANYTNLGTMNISLLRFNQLPSPLTLYDEAGWLLLQTPQNSSQATDINYAVWQIFDSTAPSFGNSAYWLNQAQLEAQAGFPGVNFYQVGIFTPVNQYDSNPEGPQELLTILPEPGTVLLFASGLAGLLARRKLR